MIKEYMKRHIKAKHLDPESTANGLRPIVNKVNVMVDEMYSYINYLAYRAGNGTTCYNYVRNKEKWLYTGFQTIEDRADRTTSNYSRKASGGGEAAARRRRGIKDKF